MPDLLRKPDRLKGIMKTTTTALIPDTYRRFKKKIKYSNFTFI